MMLDIVVPVYNEGQGILRLFDEIQDEIRVQKKVIVVYDMEEDTTLPAVREGREKYPFEVILTKNSIGRGPLNAIKVGMRAAEDEMVLVMMADSSDKLDVVEAMCRKMEEGYDLVCGSRYMKGGKQHGGPFFKGLFSRIAGISLHILTQIPTHDVTNSFKLYRKTMLDAIEIESTGGFEIGLEITVKAYTAGYKITEVPSEWFDREEGESNFHMWRWMPHYLHWYLYCVRQSWFPKVQESKERRWNEDKMGTEVMQTDIEKLYTIRFGQKDRMHKVAVWKEICAYLEKTFRGGVTGTVVDIAAGYCDFINNISYGGKKYAVDVNPDVKKYAGKGIQVIVDSIDNLAAHFQEGSVSLFFMSNFLEHIPKESIDRLLRTIYSLLEERGQVWILTPNIRYVGGKYWDFYDHVTPVTEKALMEEARLIGYKVRACIPKFLPFTTKSRLPQAQWIVRLYLKCMPLSGKLFGEQSFLVLSKR